MVMGRSYKSFEAHVRKTLGYLEGMVDRDMIVKGDSDEDSKSREL